jgi:hypothetical protein
MFLVELVDSNSNLDIESNVLGLLSLVKKRYENVRATPKINTASFLTLAKNVGMALDYDGFVDLYNSSGSIKNLIANFNKNTITLNSGSSDTKVDTPDKQSKDQDIVGKMAAQAVDI